MSDAAGYWDAQAESFDEAADHGLHDPVVRAAWESLLIPLLPPAPARVADLGCGTGSLAILLASNGHEVGGIDLAPKMIERARAKATGAGVDVRFLIGDAARPPWPEDSFDVVLSRHVLWALPDRAAVLERWIRILRPAGQLILVEGLWWTGAGMPAASVLDLLRSLGRTASVTPLADPALWGEAVSDERYLIVSPPP